MPFWGWLVVGLGAWLVAAALIVLALSVFFRGVGRIVSDEHDADAAAPSRSRATTLNAYVPERAS